jgi:hypothetical protein
VSHHAKTPSARSTTGQGTSLGAFVRGAFTIRGASGGVDGSGEHSFRLLCGLALAAFVPFLLIAPSGFAADAPCPNEAFRVGPGADLPNCRAYELATPVDKNGGEVEGFSGQFRAALDGSGITFFTQGGTTIPSPTGATATYPTYLARKSGEAWFTQRLLAPLSYGESAYSDWLGTTPDLRYSIVQAERLGYPESTFGRGLFSIDTVTNEIETIVPWNKNIEEFAYAFDGTSEDGLRIFFETKAGVTPESHEYSDNLYMWDKATQEVSLVGILPADEGGEEPFAGAFGGAYEWYASDNLLKGGALGGLAVEAANAISPSGDQIYFTAGESGQLYLRRGLTGSSPSTVRVSAPEVGVTDPNGSKPAAFQEATESGSRAFFLSSEKLTANANTGPADEGRDLYRWDASGELVDVAPDPSATAGAEVQGLVGISSDGSSGYFVAKGALASGATAGSPNLYRFVEGTGGFALSFIATLHTASGEVNVDRRNWSPRIYNPQFGGVVSAQKVWKTSRTSSDGGVLVFTSTAPITGYDNVNAAPTVGCTLATEPCAEIYRYSASDGQLTCVSCQPQGALPLGSAQLQSYDINSFLGPNTEPNVQIPRNLSPDGNRLFFETPDPLVAADTNGNEGCPYFNSSPSESEPECQDVYEWEAPGTGSCAVEEVNGGCLRLLSTGKGGSGFHFLDASQDGSDVFIATKQQLVPVDRDAVTDIYDVSVNGGIASQYAIPQPPCEGEACLGALPPPPTPGSSGSASFQGPGNAKPKHKKQRHKKSKKKHQRHAKKHSGKKKNRSGHADRALTLNSNAGGA